MKAGRSFILTYHSIDDSGSVISVAPRQFAAHMKALAASGRPVVPLQEVVRTPGGVAITFDDGFRSFRESAFPVLRDYGFPATVFVVSRYSGGQNDWPSQPPAIPRMPLMSRQEIAEVSGQGIEVGCHTSTHPRLPALEAEEVERELAECQAAIREMTGAAANTFAYPYGASSEAVRATVARRFAAACGTRLAYLHAGDDPHELPRLDSYYLRDPAWFSRVTTGTGQMYIAARAALRRVRQMM